MARAVRRSGRLKKQNNAKSDPGKTRATVQSEHLDEQSNANSASRVARATRSSERLEKHSSAKPDCSPTSTDAMSSSDVASKANLRTPPSSRGPSPRQSKSVLGPSFAGVQRPRLVGKFRIKGVSRATSCLVTAVEIGRASDSAPATWYNWVTARTGPLAGNEVTTTASLISCSTEHGFLGSQPLFTPIPSACSTGSLPERMGDAAAVAALHLPGVSSVGEDSTMRAEARASMLQAVLIEDVPQAILHEIKEFRTLQQMLIKSREENELSKAPVAEHSTYLESLISQTDQHLLSHKRFWSIDEAYFDLAARKYDLQHALATITRQASARVDQIRQLLREVQTSEANRLLEE